MKSIGISLIIVLNILRCCVSAQLVEWPTTPSGEPYRVESSYGPRIANGTFFHKGLDFNEQGTSSADGTGEKEKNYPIIAPASGTIFGIGYSGGGLKWIGVNYGCISTYFPK